MFSSRLEETIMTNSHERSGLDSPFDWLFTSANEWGRMLIAAQELRGSDEDLFDALSHARVSDDPLTPEEARKVHSLVQLLRSLDLDPEAIRKAQPNTMGKLETTCLGCAERARCDHDLANGSVAATHPEFCPNAERLAVLKAAFATPAP
jgi:hypothetical protein